VQIKLALPKGRLQNSTALMLDEAGFTLADYSEGSRSYRPQCETSPGTFAKVLHEKDIAIQVAIGNYDLGICRLDWVEELLVKYHSDAVVKVRALGSGRRTIYAAVAAYSEIGSLEELRNTSKVVRTVSEYPNLAESFALKQRLRRFQIFPVWGAADVYLPENADLAILAATSSEMLRDRCLTPIATIIESGACLVANRNSIESKDLSQFLAALSSIEINGFDDEAAGTACNTRVMSPAGSGPAVSLALPDGHQQRHTVGFLNKVGLEIDGYNVGESTSRPRSGYDGITVKVIRPQDMPQQVANGNFDLAITGRDWLKDHRFRFPSSPVKELLELGFGRVRIVAVVTEDTPASSTAELVELKRGTRLRVASEYINIADKYAHDNHLTPCRIIPTWGASEAFLPEDADVLIENTETGSTIARNKLKIIDTLFESSACLIGNTESVGRPEKSDRISFLVEAMRRGVDSRTAS